MRLSDHITALYSSDEFRLLRRSEFLVLHLLLELMKATSRRVPSGAVYAFPGEKYIAKRCSLSRTHVSRAVNALHTRGFIAITHRRKLHGMWQTNLYRLGATLKAVCNKLKPLFFGLFHHVRETAHRVKEYKYYYKGKAEGGDNGTKAPPNCWPSVYQNALNRLSILENN